MGIVQVQNNFPAFEFAGESSRDYGVYITDVNVFDGAARDIELVDIPGRNGAYIIDNGRFNGITLVYDCAMGANGSDGAADFAENMAAIRAWLSSVVGYARLEDDINPDEYRMAAFSGGIEVDTNGKRTGEFSIEFTARPERFLKSGETAVTVTSGDTITNPTKFSAAPLLAVSGYGTINIGSGGNILLENSPLGEVALNSPVTAGGGGTYVPTGGTKTLKLDVAALNVGDAIGVPNMDNVGVECLFTPELSPGYVAVEDGTYTKYYTKWTGNHPVQNIYGTADAGGAMRLTHSFRIYNSTAGTYEVGNITIRVNVPYDGNDKITVEPLLVSHTFNNGVTGVRFWIGWSQIYGQSTQQTTGDPAYIDLDLGEAYKVESGEIVSINRNVHLPATLPNLLPGANVISFDNTFNNVKITPRWWAI